MSVTVLDEPVGAGAAVGGARYSSSWALRDRQL
jgi:hypothetical protein